MNKAQKLIRLIEDFTHPSDEHTDDLHESLTEESNDHYKKLGPFEKPASVASVQRYSHLGYTNINPYLRTGKHNSDYQTVRHTTEADVDNIKRVTNNPTKHDFHAYRISNHVKIGDLKEGDMLHDKAFTSVSISPNDYKSTAKAYSDNPKSTQHSTFRIHVKAGTKGHYVGDESNYPEEKEFLLHPGTKFKVHKIHKDENGGTFAELHIHSQED